MYMYSLSHLPCHHAAVSAPPSHPRVMHLSISPLRTCFLCHCRHAFSQGSLSLCACVASRFLTSHDFLACAAWLPCHANAKRTCRGLLAATPVLSHADVLRRCLSVMHVQSIVCGLLCTGHVCRARIAKHMLSFRVAWVRWGWPVNGLRMDAVAGCVCRCESQVCGFCGARVAVQHGAGR